MKRVAIALLAGVAAVAGLGYSASAADMAVKALPPAPVLPTWTGFYIGVHGGAAWQSSQDWSFSDPNNFLLPATVNGGNSSRANMGAVGGVQVGYNWQFAPAWVAGIEGDFSWASLSDHRTLAPVPFVAGNPAGSSLSMTQTTQWLSSVRAKIGFVGWWNTMFYATGGVAMANFDYSAQNTFGPPFSPNTFQSNTILNETKSGWVAGAGAEWMATPNILLRVEYLYYNFNGGADSSALLLPQPSLPIPFNYSWSKENIQVLRIAGSYKF